MTGLEHFGLGVLGGFLAELLGLYRLRTQAGKALPAYLRSVFYWAITVLMVLAGGALVSVYCWSGIDLKPIVSVNLGASAPLLIATLVQASPPKID